MIGGMILPYFLRWISKFSVPAQKGGVSFGPETLSLFGRIFSKRPFYGKALPFAYRLRVGKTGKVSKRGYSQRLKDIFYL